MPKINSVAPKKAQEPENYNQLLVEFVQKGGQGLQKTFIKKLWTVHQDLIDNANPSTLRMMFWSPALSVCPEGVKLLATILLKIGVVPGLRLLEKRIFEEAMYPLTENECQRYGEVFATAWKIAYQDANFDMIEELETKVISVFCQHAIYNKIPSCANKFAKVLSAFACEKKQDKNMDNMMTTILNGCLFGALTAKNHIVQGAAARILYMFYPLVGEDSDDMSKALESQHRHMADLLSSDIINIRTEAVKSVLKALAEYWLIIPKHVVKELLGYIIDTLSRDTVVAVRAATFEGLNEMAFVPACLNVFEHALKCVAIRGIQDKSERVRLVAIQLLSRLKNHKFINVFDVIDRDDAIAKLDIETVEACRRQLVPIMHILLPISSKDIDEAYYRPRINYILGKSRLALLSYFRLLGPMKIIDAGQSARLIEMLTTWAYRYLRKKNGPPLAETSEGYQKARAYLECALVIYMSCKGMLMLDDRLKAKCDTYFGKIVKEIFEKYGNTPILGTATAISSVIPKENLKDVAADVLARLADDEVPVEAVEPFLESAIHFNPDSVFDSFDKGLSVLGDLYGEQQKQKAKKRDVGDPEEIMQMTLSRLKYILQSPTTANLVAMKDVYRLKTTDFLKKVDLVREAIEVRLAKTEDVTHSLSDSVLLATLETRFILPLYAVVNGDSQDTEEQKKMFESVKQLLIWFDEDIVKKMKTFGDHNQEFLISLSRTFLECVNVALWACDFVVRQREYENEEDRPEEEPENDEQQSVTEIVANVVLSFCNSGTPVELFAPVLRVAATLCEESFLECHPQMASVLRFVPKWINKQSTISYQNESVNQFEVDKEPLEALRQFQKRVSDTDCWDETAAKRMMYHFVLFSIVSLADSADEEEFEDPRREEYIPPHFVSFAINKFILKEKNLTMDLLDEIQKNYLQEENIYFNPPEAENTNKLLMKLAALSQFLRVLEKNSKHCQQRIKESLEACTARCLDYFANSEDLASVENHVMISLNGLLDVELPDGF